MSVKLSMYEGPPMPPANSSAPDLCQRVHDAIELVRPAVRADGGDVELVSVRSDGVVEVRFHGACITCPSSNMTLKMGIERTVRERVPEIKSVVSVQ